MLLCLLSFLDLVLRRLRLRSLAFAGLALANVEAVTDAAKGDLACHMTRAFAKSISAEPTPEDLATALFDRLSKYPEKAAFALDLLYIENIKSLRAPPYIDKGLTWLAGRLTGGEGAI